MADGFDQLRAAAVAWAREVAADPGTLYLDTETTGFGDADVVDIAVVDNRGEVLLNSLVRPTRPIPADASRVHGILDRHVADAPEWPTVAAALAALVVGRRVVVYNAPFDAGIIGGCCARHRIVVPAVRWECAMRQYAAYRGTPGRHGGPKWHRLERAVAEFDAPAGGHRALGDAIACRDVVHGMSRALAELPF